jgi:hypothetical protein
MSSILSSIKTGLVFSLISVPKLVLVAFGLVLANAVALCLPYSAWQLWFPKKHNDAAPVQGNTGESPKKGEHGSTTAKPPKPADPNAFGVCCVCGVPITFFEGIAILVMKDLHPKMSWVLLAGQAAGLALGLGLGLGLLVLVVGGCSKLIDMGATRHTERKSKERTAKEKVEGWEKVEVENKEKEQ